MASSDKIRVQVVDMGVVKETKSSMVTMSKSRAVGTLVVFVIALLAVGLLAGLVKPSCTVGPSSATAVAQASTRSDRSKLEPWKNHRLPVHLIPVHYDLTLHPDFYQSGGKPGTFSGNVSIFINVTGPTDSRHFLVHVKSLTVDGTSARLCPTSTPVDCRASSTPLAIARTFEYAENEFLVVELERPVEPGSFVVIRIEFKGSLENGINGLYRSRYTDSRNGETKYLVTTKFQPTFARRAFPCLDEPQFKSTFTVTLVHDDQYTALSNMPPESNRSVGSHLVATTFKKSVPMVTYLACFIISQFTCKENATKRGTPVRVYSTPDKVDQTDYALDIGVRILDFYENFFGLPYPLPKIDHIAIPDFSSGAMENWGLITYREVYLLFNESEASPANQQRLATVIAHELAHMWFGNLVTMTWWDDLWLNEGFASYVEYLGIVHVHPDWDMDSQFLVDDLFPVYTVDSVISSHPIIVPVSHPDQISEVFDSISYSKGASVLRMLENYLGMDTFKSGLQSYMREHQYQTTVTDDLWNALSKVPGAPNVKQLMDTWTMQMGLPVVKLDVFGNQLRLRQERFLLDPNADKTAPPSSFNYLWEIPLTWTTSRGTVGHKVLDSKEVTVDLGFSFNQSVDWIKCNINETSYHRHNYMNSNWNVLSASLLTNHESLSASDRAGLIDNAFNLAKASLVGYEVPLKLSLYLERENHFTPWRSFDISVGYIKKMLVTGSYYGQWQAYVRQLVSPVFRRVGLQETGSHLGRLMTSIVCHLACANGDQLCLRNVSSLFLGWLDNEHYISPGLRDFVYNYAMQQIDSEEVWDRVWQRYQNATAPQEKNRLLSAVSQTRVVWLLNRLLDYSTDGTKIRDQDFFTLISYITNNPIGRPIVWNWARINWSRLVDKFTLNSRNLGRMIPGIVNTFNSEFQLNEVESFFSQYPDAGAGERGRKQVLETIRSNIIWMNVHADHIVDWLRSNTNRA